MLLKRRHALSKFNVWNGQSYNNDQWNRGSWLGELEELKQRAAMLGEASYFPVPEVIGVRLVSCPRLQRQPT